MKRIFPTTMLTPSSRSSASCRQHKHLQQLRHERKCGVSQFCDRGDVRGQVAVKSMPFLELFSEIFLHIIGKVFLDQDREAICIQRWHPPPANTPPICWEGPVKTTRRKMEKGGYFRSGWHNSFFYHHHHQRFKHRALFLRLVRTLLSVLFCAVLRWAVVGGG